ncbi:MAG TPA: hypothetical protein DIT48_04360 [Actinobacteria bacterium]|nr:hypothetical protein [Actinomycetota bacterium]
MASPTALQVPSNPLRGARVERGETLLDVSRATGIPVPELEALERATSVAHLPDPVRARRHLVTYADYLELEPAPKPPVPARPVLRIIVGGDEPGRSLLPGAASACGEWPHPSSPGSPPSGRTPPLPGPTPPRTGEPGPASPGSSSPP